MIAIKVAWPAAPGRGPSRKRFLRAREITARLDHPHVVHVGPLCELEGLSFYEMPLMGLRRISHDLAEGSLPTFKRAVQLLQQTALALDFAHRLGIVHGALRPSKLLVGLDGSCLVNGFTVVPGEPLPSPEVAPDVVGDPAYMSPEQWRADGALDGQADQYALALIALQLLTGQERVMHDAAGGIEIFPPDVPLLRRLRAGVPLEANTALRRALSRYPENRYKHVGDFVAALSGPR